MLCVCLDHCMWHTVGTFNAPSHVSGCSVGNATPRLRQRDICKSTKISTQYCSQADTPAISQRAYITPLLWDIAVVSEHIDYKLFCTNLSMPVWSRSTLSLWSHPACCRSSSSSLLVIRLTRLAIAGDHAITGHILVEFDYLDKVHPPLPSSSPFRPSLLHILYYPGPKMSWNY